MALANERKNSRGKRKEAFLAPERVDSEEDPDQASQMLDLLEALSSNGLEALVHFLPSCVSEAKVSNVIYYLVVLRWRSSCSCCELARGTFMTWTSQPQCQ